MPDLTETEQLLILAAACRGLGPETPLDRANAVTIVNQVLMWRGQTTEQIAAGWQDEQCSSEHAAVYAVLVRMTSQLLADDRSRPAERPGPALFEGRGNWGIPGDPEHPPCWPQFNSCRLTREGERLAGELARQLPARYPNG